MENMTPAELAAEELETNFMNWDWDGETIDDIRAQAAVLGMSIDSLVFNFAGKSKEWRPTVPDEYQGSVSGAVTNQYQGENSLAGITHYVEILAFDKRGQAIVLKTTEDNYAGSESTDAIATSQRDAMKIVDSYRQKSDSRIDFNLDHLTSLDFTDLDFTQPGMMPALTVAKRELVAMGITVEVKAYTVPQGYIGNLSGEILAVGKTFTAQHLGDSNLVMHSNDRLDHTPSPGDIVSFGYQDGRAQVFGYKVSSSELTGAEAEYVRQALLTASREAGSRLSQEQMDTAIEKALEGAKHAFWWDGVPVTVVTEYVTAPDYLKEAQERLSRILGRQIPEIERSLKMKPGA